jgi:mannosyltransferase
MGANRTKDSKLDPILCTILLILILGLSAALRFFNLGTESYWIDEMCTVIEAQQSIHQLIMSGRLDQPLAYYLPLHFWVQIFGTTEPSMRSFSALAGIGSIVLVYLIGRKLSGEGVGLLSAFLMAISGFQIYYSQESRYYSFFELATLLSFLFLIPALMSKRTIHFALYGVASGLMVYSHAYGIFILAAQNLFFLLQGSKYRNVIRTWLICQALVLLAIVPSFYPLFFGGGGLVEGGILSYAQLPTPSLWDPLRSVYRFVLSPRRDRSWEIVLANYAAAGTFFMAATWIYAVRQGKSNWAAAAKGWVGNLREIPDVASKLLLLSCWLLCPILLPFIISIAIVPIYLDRYTISAAPALYLLLALGIFSIRRAVPLMISIGVMVILVVPSLRHYYVTDIKEQWKEAAVYVEENSGKDEVIVFAPNDEGIKIQQRSFNWYYRGFLRGCGLDSNLSDPVAIWEALMKCISGHNRFWVIIRGPNETGGRFHSFFLDPNQTNMHLLKGRQFVGISVYLVEFRK